MTSYGESLESALSTQIKVELVERGLGQKDLAEMVDVHPVTMSHYLKGKRSMPMPTFFRVAEAFGISPKTLMERTEARVRPEA
jgi:plasmid maintenance system antidote protein VapI